MQLEEGEIEDESGDEIDPYTPLERPTFMHTTPSNVVNHSDDDDNNDGFSTNEDSDSDSCLPKKAKIRKKMPQSSQRNKKYSIWCRNTNDQLTDILGSFGMQNPENDRSVETYTVPKPMLVAHRRKQPVRRDGFEPDFVSKTIEELETNEMNTYEEIATDIARKLDEPNKGLILRIVIIVGKDRAIEFFNKTKEIEKEGGMLIINKTRRRTSGGIFIYLIRSDKQITESQKNEIFEESNVKFNFNKRMLKRMKDKKRHKEWIDKMNDEKASELGQEVLSNPPPSPEPEPSESLPELPLRRDLIDFDRQGIVKEFERREIEEKEQLAEEHDRRNVVEYDDLHSVDLIYD